MESDEDSLIGNLAHHHNTEPIIENGHNLNKFEESLLDEMDRVNDHNLTLSGVWHIDTYESANVMPCAREGAALLYIYKVNLAPPITIHYRSKDFIFMAASHINSMTRS